MRSLQSRYQCCRRLRVTVFVFGLLVALPAVALPPGSTVEAGAESRIGFGAESGAEAMSARARAIKLAEHPGWLALLHYKPEAFSRSVLSQADDAAFFLSPHGKTDPVAELQADLAAFMAPSSPGHAQCLFPARWHWLKQQLEIDNAVDVPCPKLASWLERVSTRSLTLVFPVMYLNNPASSFGHSFLRFDAEPVLLSYALNYAADVNRDDGFVSYAYNGLFGGYTGVFNTRLYFETVQQYSAIENRDIWEYRLDFSPEEILQLARHVWEVTGIRFDYYFFRENCSYRLLALLDAVRPQAALTMGDAFAAWAIPVDTVRALQAGGLILHHRYRPSLASQLRTGFAGSNAEARDQVMRLVDDEQDPAAVIKQLPVIDARQLDLAYTLLQFRGQADSRRGDELLSLRSRLPDPATKRASSATAVTPAPPQSGHGSARITIAGGESNRQTFVELQLRPAFHDLVDAPRGYEAGAEINVLDTRLRWLPAQDRLRLERLDFISLVSLNPVREWVQPFSWQLAARLEQQRRNAVTSDRVFVGRGGGGYSAQLANSTLFAMLLLEADMSRQFQHDYSLLAGVQLGAAWMFAGSQALLTIENGTSFSGFELDRDVLGLDWQINLCADAGLRAGYRKIRYEGFDDNAWSLRLQYYF